MTESGREGDSSERYDPQMVPVGLSIVPDHVAVVTRPSAMYPGSSIQSLAANTEDVCIFRSIKLCCAILGYRSL